MKIKFNKNIKRKEKLFVEIVEEKKKFKIPLKLIKVGKNKVK